MRHLKKGRKLNRNPAHRKAMFTNLMTSLFRHGRIETTSQKAKSLRGFAEKLITLAKKGDLHARRLAYKTIRDQEILAKLFSKIATNYQERKGGYTRVIKSRVRKGDCASLSVIELVGHEVSKNPVEKSQAD